MGKFQRFIINFFLPGFAVVCVFLSIRWSELPCVNNRFLELLFVYKRPVDSSMLNIVTGYLTGYLVYLLTVVVPDAKRKKPIQKLFYKRLSVYINKSSYLLLLMCKCCCSKETFAKVIKEKDACCFNEDFYNAMPEFDLTTAAYTLLKKKDSDEHLRWYEYLNERYESFHKEIEELYLMYHSYLEDEDLALLEKIKSSPFIDTFVGTGQTFNSCYTGKDGLKYVEDIPIAVVYAGNPNLSKLFRPVNGEPSPILVDYVELLRESSEYLRKRYTQFNEKYAVDIL